MKPKEPIDDLLKELQKLYDSDTNINHQTYYSKLALLELSGWLEDVLDEIILTYGHSKLVEPKNIEKLEKEIVKKTYGCDYKLHFREMLIQVIGITNVEKLEDTLKNMGNFQTLVDQLSSIYNARNSAAHTSIAGTMKTYQAPSSMRTYLRSLHPILEMVEIELNKI